ncbi:ATP-dependent transcriptional regulator, MalT-like, LuxR family [Beutenbergia cavernae DSM 12333]|uniref:ATP-dependent transcriptional regulator, MalT-like, LuxR family n=1 Tax=Beutenbergia cavernae (strain ATCC BAA-8 / DSM 12333 / CCUG 43141 / JCM 11478 / NBRC 16432 / NCIMB 13614 / HKI 0122) TaxID=471853 RepID=C5C615_BEUC1|nr:LuxR family transcriptional regulator [Beutenbergia cavernae]ACQ82373.1 ATP-dependent transcriptional regulator, MalT-like, LuxR family [Beutenbergia cavernae DSM 12333]
MGDAPGPVPAAAELDGLLLDAKLAVPARRTAAVSRADLIQGARSSGRRVVGVTAPAGYGKSTMLAEWAALEDRPVAWVSLDTLDDDPSSLLVVLASAFARVSDGPEGLVADMVGPDASVLGRAAPRLASALRRSPTPFVLVLDDLHELQSPACHDVLGVVVAGIPAGSQLVAASRTEQPHLPRLRAAGEIVEIVASDLVLDVAGTLQVFAASHVPVSPEAAAAVTERTEGWPVGIYLASLIARHSGGDAVAVTGEDPYVADYLQRESYRRLPEDMRTFLRRTAVLDNLCGPLCDEVTGEPGSREMLRRLEASSLFLVPLDRRRWWFRYHALFREFLLGELTTVEAQLVDGLRRRAADWYEAHGSPERAVEQLLQTSDRERCVRLVTRLVMTLFQAGQLSTVGKWLRALGDDAVVAYPPLAVLAGYVAAYEGRAGEAERWGAVVDAAAFDGEMVDGSASFDSARAMYRALRCPQGPQALLDDAALAVASEPEWSVWRDTALTASGLARLLVGDVDGAAREFERTVAAAAAVGNADTLVFCEAQLAQRDMDHGQWERGRERIRHALDAIEEHRMYDYPTSAPAFAAAARLALHDGDLAETRRLLTRGMRVRTFCTYAFPTLAVRARMHLARTSWAAGDVAAVRHLLREIDDVLLHRPNLGVLVDEVADLRQEFGAGSRAASMATSVPPLSPAELRLLPYLQTHLTIREIGERLFVSRNTASSEIGSIYRKLGASSRSEAVRQAVTMGLLGE